MCDLKRQQISLGTRHRNSRRTWIANLLYRFTGGRLILEGWHRALDIPSSAEGLNKKDLFLHRPPVFEQRPRFSSFIVTWARAVPNPSLPSYPSLSRATPLYIFFSSSSLPPLLENARFRSETNPNQFGRNRSASEERTRYRISYYSMGILLLSIFPPIAARIHTYIDTLHACAPFVKLVWQRIHYPYPALPLSVEIQVSIESSYLTRAFLFFAIASVPANLPALCE